MRLVYSYCNCCRHAFKLLTWRCVLDSAEWVEHSPMWGYLVHKPGRVVSEKTRSCSWTTVWTLSPPRRPVFQQGGVTVITWISWTHEVWWRLCWCPGVGSVELFFHNTRSCCTNFNPWPRLALDLSAALTGTRKSSDLAGPPLLPTARRGYFVLHSTFKPLTFAMETATDWLYLTFMRIYQYSFRCLDSIWSSCSDSPCQEVGVLVIFFFLSEWSDTSYILVLLFPA